MKAHPALLLADVWADAQPGRRAGSNVSSLARHRLFFLYLADRTTFFTDRLAVLHVAPEERLQDVFRSLPNLDYTSVDLDSPPAMLRMDITQLAFDDECFDVVICSHVLEHVPDDRRVMHELYRVLRPGGWDPPLLG